MHVVRRLRARPEDELAVAVDRGDGGVLLERQVRAPLIEEEVLEDVIRLGEPLLDVAERERDLLVDVPLVSVFVDTRLRVRKAFFRLGEGSERLVLHRDQIERVGRGQLVARDDERDRIADETDGVRTERVLVLADRQDAVGDGQIAARENEMDARVRLGARRVHRPDARVGHGAAQQFGMHHPREDEIVREDCLAGDLGAAVDAATREADDPRLAVGVHGFTALLGRAFRLVVVRRFSVVFDPDRRGRLHRFDDLLIAGAPADVAGERLANLIGARIGIPLQERLGRDEQARRAVAALRRPEVGEGLLQRVQAPVITEALDGHDVAGVAFEREEQAGQRRRPIHQHRAGAAFAELAAVLRARQIQILAQDLEQRLVGIERDLPRFTVDAQGNYREARGWVAFHESTFRATDRRSRSAPGSSARGPGRTAIMSATASAGHSPPGRYHVADQLIAPSIARVVTAASQSTNSPRLLPSVTRRRSARS